MILSCQDIVCIFIKGILYLKEFTLDFRADISTKAHFSGIGIGFKPSVLYSDCYVPEH